MKATILVALAVGVAAPARADDLWIVPVDRAAFHLAAYDEAERPYSTPARPRDITGELQLACEHNEGRPCGDGAGAYEELDARAGFGDWLVGGLRLRARGGSTDYGTGLDVDRAHVDARWHDFGLEVGRDAFVLGPGAHTQVGWGDNAPPLDFARASYATERGGLMYLVGRLRDPQTLHGNLVTIARGELVAGPVVVGAMQLLQLEGDGAPHLGPWDFIAEHFTRGNPSAGPDDTSNRRVGLDVSWRIAGFGGARLYYQLMFEDWRRQFADALRYDADHVAGADFPNGLVIEWAQTGFRSMEHAVRTTGFTNAGRVVGDPLGPAAEALYVAQRLDTFKPWLEVVRLASDTYSYGAGQPIVRTNDALAEFRYRVGLLATRRIDAHLHIDLDARAEHIEDFAFVRGADRNGIGADVALVWQP
ncbi:MAG: capsule assembly Wzi family protein [Deltaproteobacteria bacterium]